MYERSRTSDLTREQDTLLKELAAVADQEYFGRPWPELQPGAPKGQPPYKPFVVVPMNDRRFAVLDFGSGFYDEGISCYVIVDLATGGYVRTTPAMIKVAAAECADALFDPELVPADDPVRRWLALDPAAADLTAPVPVVLESFDQLARFCAAELVRTDQPELIVVPAPTAGRNLEAPHRELLATRPAAELPYDIVFGPAIYRITWIGSGRGRPTGTPA
jgi:hypothetical protein